MATTAMQRTINLPPSHPVRSMEGLARQIALPHEHAPQRFPSFPALERTALMGFSQPTTIVVPSGTVSTIALARQAAWPAWGTVQTEMLTCVRYRTAAIGTTAVLENFWTVPVTAIQGIPRNGIASPLPMVASASIVGYTPIPLPWLYNPIGLDNGLGPLGFTYIPPNMDFAITVTGLGANSAAIATFDRATEVVVDVELWNSPGELNPAYSSDNFTFTISAGNTGGSTSSRVNSTNGIWIRPRNLTFTSAPAATAVIPSNYIVTVFISGGTLTYVPSTTTAGNMLGAGTSVSTFAPLLSPAEFANSKLPWYATRTTAAALLGTNVTQVLNKGGTILGGRISPAIMPMWSATSSYVNTLHPAEKSFLPCETGVYTYCPPSTDMSGFYDYTMAPFANGDAVTTSPVYRLDNDALYNIMYITPAGATEIMALTVDWHIEFRTSSALFQIGLSTMPLESLHTAQLALAHAGFFFENPEHKGVLGKVTAAAKKFGPSMVSAFNPVAGQLLKSIISSAPRSSNKMKPTSAAGSGLTAKTSRQTGGTGKQGKKNAGKGEKKKGKGKK